MEIAEAKPCSLQALLPLSCPAAEPRSSIAFMARHGRQSHCKVAPKGTAGGPLIFVSSKLMQQEHEPTGFIRSAEASRLSGDVLHPAFWRCLGRRVWQVVSALRICEKVLSLRIIFVWGGGRVAELLGEGRGISCSLPLT